MKLALLVILLAGATANSSHATDTACGYGWHWALSDRIVCEAYIYPDGSIEYQCGNYGECQPDMDM
jgi:hypothetical protein